MLIRREDKTIVYYIAILGAVLSVFIASTLPARLRAKNGSQTSCQNESTLHAGAIDKLKQASELSIQMDVIESVTRQLSAAELKDKPPSTPDSFFASLTGWKVAVLSIGAGAAGYGLFWGVMWSGVVALYTFIRGVYFIIGRVSPHCAAAQKPSVIQDGKVTFLRNPDRILPLIIKLVVLMTVTMSLIIVVAWQWTSNNLWFN